MRRVIYPWIITRVGNGTTCKFWSDNWSPFGNLAEFLRLAPMRRLGLPQHETLSDLIQDGQWRLPPARSEQQVTLYAYISTLTITEEDDSVEWVVNDKISLKYSTGVIYKELKHHNPSVPWSKIVWVSRNTPKHSFLTWLFIRDRCPIRDCLINWGLNTPPNCLLYNGPLESRNHLFFTCSYSWSVWSSMAQRCNFAPVSTWDHSVAALMNRNSSKPEKLLCLLAWQCTIYLLWKERNNRLHRNCYRSTDSISSLAVSTIRTKIAAIRSSSPSLSSVLSLDGFCLNPFACSSSWCLRSSIVSIGLTTSKLGS
ncbi:hypothetical protein Bca4012_027288 [Brassica carinata]